MSEELVKNPYLDGTGLSQVWAEILKKFVEQEAGKGLSTNDLTNALLTKLNGIAEGAQVNVIESVKVNDVALDITDKTVNVLVPTGALAALDKVSEDDLDTELAALIESLAKKADVYTKAETDAEIKKAVAKVYKIKGSIAFEEATLSGQVEGNVYNITDAFTTTADFIEGAGTKHPAGTNIVVVNIGTAEEPSLKWDAMAGTYDFSDFLKKDDIRPLTSEEIAAICVIPE